MKFSEVPKGLYIISGIFSLLGLLGGYFLEVGASFIVLIFIYALFWRYDTPPVIIAAMTFQWLAVAIGYIYLSISDADMEALLWRPQYSLDQINRTFWLALGGLVFFSLGLKLAVYKLKPKKIPEKLLQLYDTQRIAVIYAIFTVFADAAFSLIRFTVPGLSQPVNMLGYFKWALLFLMVYISFRKQEKLSLVGIILGIEVIIGFTGFFSEFKEVLIMLPLVYLTFNRLKSPKQISSIVFFAILLFNLGAIWSYVKIDYREFLSGGVRKQQVVVSETEALSKLTELIGGVTAETYGMGVESMVKRFFMLEYYSATVNHVPERRPFMEGENFEAAIKHVLMPRMFFPDKEAVHDSEVTFELTGIQVAGAEHGTSISPGFMAQAYADYGPFFMFFPIFLLGFLLGSIYKHFVRKIKNPLWSYGFIFPMFFLINVFGRNIIKITGDTFMYLIVFSLMVRFLLPYADKMIRKRT